MNDLPKVSFNTIPYLNNRVLFMGLTTTEIVVLIAVLLVVFFVMGFYSIPILIFVFFLLGKSSNIQRKTKRSAYEIAFIGNKNSYQDEGNILEFLKRKSNEGS